MTTEQNLAAPCTSLGEISRRLSKRLSPLCFGSPIAHVYNPLGYAFRSHEVYLERYGKSKAAVLLLGMNPGPFGMAQTGVPFGDVRMVRDWLGISAPVGRPKDEHPRRPIRGFDCGRSEVSGTRLWGWARERFGAPEAFFARFFVANYCPLMFLEKSGRNRTPDKLPAAERALLFEYCDEALRDVVAYQGAETVVGVGAFAADRARRALGDSVQVGQILHPSPASPLANRGWAERIEDQLSSMGVEF